MHIPSEEQIELVISELKVGSEMAHPSESPKESEHDCEMCSYLREMAGRGSGEPTVIDHVTLNALDDPKLVLAVMMGGNLLIAEMVRAVRTAFFIGYKVGLNEASQKEMDKVIETLLIPEEN